MKQPPDFVKGAAWAAGYKIHEVGYSLCLEDDDANELIRRYRKSPPPIRKLSKPRAKAVPA
jgi:hypothetical protein